VEGTSFGWKDLTKSETGQFSIGDTFASPTPLHSFGMMFLLIVIYAIIIWYLDHVVSNNRGTNESYIFFLTPKYWEHVFCKKRALKRKREQKKENIETSLEYTDLGKVDPSVENERDKVIEDIKQGVACSGLRVINLKKRFHRYPCGIKSKKDTFANKGIFLDMSEKELLCILGHNGAGKSTMIGVLTGVIAPSSGTATLGGYDISEEIDDIRQIIGVVPQFDILWEELTAEEHMIMFCKIKGVPNDQIDKVVDEKLTGVNLRDVKKARVRTFSGGMKRRLTVAIS